MLVQGFVDIAVLATKGSAPRDCGAMMRVSATSQSGTIGGGQLEFRATQTARQMLADGRQELEEEITLGASCGQCCGGQVRLRYQQDRQDCNREKQPVWIFGAGHVGRAIAAALAPLENFAVTVVDARQDWLLDVEATPMLAADPLAAIPLVPQGADVFILTHCHDLDLALCHAALTRGFASINLIGSTTKWTRFQRRLRDMDSDPAAITCPIGDKRLGKTPSEIALGVAHKLLLTQTTRHSTSPTTRAMP